MKLYYFIVIILVFLAIHLFNCDIYFLLGEEDHLFEYLTSIFFVAAGVMLLRRVWLMSRSEKLGITQVLLILAAVAFVFVGMEEISWGQRIFNISTPDYLMEINDQNELNLHNIDKKFFDRALSRVIVIFVFVASFLVYGKGNTSIWGIPLPSLSLLMCFVLVPFYNKDLPQGLDFHHLLFIPVLYSGYKLYRSNTLTSSSLRYVLLSIVFMISLPYVIYYLTGECPVDQNSTNEYREFLFSLAVLFYSYEIYNTDIMSEG